VQRHRCERKHRAGPILSNYSSRHRHRTTSPSVQPDGHGPILGCRQEQGVGGREADVARQLPRRNDIPDSALPSEWQPEESDVHVSVNVGHCFSRLDQLPRPCLLTLGIWYLSVPRTVGERGWRLPLGGGESRSSIETRDAVSKGTASFPAGQAVGSADCLAMSARLVNAHGNIGLARPATLIFVLLMRVRPSRCEGGCQPSQGLSTGWIPQALTFQPLYQPSNLSN
jgi:hypothetical protein